MLRTKVTRISSYDHSTQVRVDTQIDTTPELFIPEVVSLLKTCFERQPNETLKAIEMFMEDIYDLHTKE